MEEDVWTKMRWWEHQAQPAVNLFSRNPNAWKCGRRCRDPEDHVRDELINLGDGVTLVYFVPSWYLDVLVAF